MSPLVADQRALAVAFSSPSSLISANSGNRFAQASFMVHLTHSVGALILNAPLE